MVITKTKTAGKKEAFSTNVEIRLVYFGSFFLLGRRPQAVRGLADRATGQEV